MAKRQPQHLKKTPKRRTARVLTIVLIVILVAGIALLLYPPISDQYNSSVMSQTVSSYDEAVSAMSSEEIEAAFAAAHEYNEDLAAAGSTTTLVDPEVVAGYDDLLAIGDDSVMGYVTVASINQCLPIYHGTSDEVLAHGAGHLQGSSLPVGGESTHAVVMAHRGLPSARLFTDLDRLEIGDTFTITVLDEVFTYEVDQTAVIDPTDIDQLYIEEGSDYCTLMTCTPYGINTQRLLVRGHRIPNAEESAPIDRGRSIDPLLVIAIVVVILCLIAVALLAVYYRHQKRRLNS